MAVEEDSIFVSKFSHSHFGYYRGETCKCGEMIIEVVSRKHEVGTRGIPMCVNSSEMPALERIYVKDMRKMRCDV